MGHYMICPICHDEFTPSRSDAKTCTKEKCRKRQQRNEKAKLSETQLSRAIDPAADHQVSKESHDVVVEDGLPAVKPRPPHASYKDSYPDGQVMTAPDSRWWSIRSPHHSDTWPNWLEAPLTKTCDVASGCGKKFETRLAMLRWCEKCQ